MKHVARRNVRLDGERQRPAPVRYYQCSGCNRRCDDPVYDLDMIREAGCISCCPERKMKLYVDHKLVKK
ncbi:hypothetical protein CC53_gp117 [Rhizobium phage vB_RleS_L338C]|uniref:hypothetical protein n=1 Tax=Rhizobium phage vB_RleS_L338C TaxID=1414737 RepID=UPI0003D95105|nr:hypothetical protein CC53_gp117 [Rhizobium phage vB_RleS_L338C]AHC30534.1 hypothetical protein L338C_117 [Rhizobium phage vB_RleS_L338C]